MSTHIDGTTDFDTKRLQRWLTAVVDPSITDLTATRMGGGNSSGRLSARRPF